MSAKSFLIGSFIMFILFMPISRAQEAVVYRNAVNVTDPVQRISALKGFMRDFPNSYYLVGTRYYLFDAYAELGKPDSALFYADKFINSYPENAKLGAYVDVSEVLAEKKMGLDSADVYSDRALNMAESRGVRDLAAVIDIRARVLNLTGKPADAMDLEEKAVAADSNNADYLNNLSIFEAGAGKKLAAVKTSAKAILMGNYDEAVVNFNKWLKEVEPEEKENTALRDKTVNNLLAEFFKSSKNGKTIAAKSNAAVFLAKTDVNVKEAEKYALEALNSLTNKSSLENKILYTKNYAMVLASAGKNVEALKELNSIENLVDPWDTDFWYTLGKIYEKQKENNKAANAYLSGMIANPTPKLTNSLKLLGYNEGEIMKRIEMQVKRLEKFEPGHFKKPGSYDGKTVLAELFTGAECPPCAGADFAFDALSEYYPRTAVDILVYHVHIPAPDPMTNPQTFQRYLFYGGNFGTPTVFIDGTEQITGGGPKFLTPNRFHVYQYAIDKFLDEKPEAVIKGSASLVKDDVDVSLSLKHKKELNGDVKLHIALVEKSVNYPGGNGVTNNIFVVRALSGGADGLDLNRGKNNFTVKDTFNVGKIENNLTAYLDDPTKDPSWRANTRFTGWREKTDKINMGNLAVVAWLQNNTTKKILQACYINVVK